MHDQPREEISWHVFTAHLPTGRAYVLEEIFERVLNSQGIQDSIKNRSGSGQYIFEDHAIPRGWIRIGIGKDPKNPIQSFFALHITYHFPPGMQKYADDHIASVLCEACTHGLKGDELHYEAGFPKRLRGLSYPN